MGLVGLKTRVFIGLYFFKNYDVFCEDMWILD